ncbi:RNA pseudouridine synthase [Noviherbaspirillum denitrificans]|uniref:Pseudouridine synthase n=1 Tax=Noviherbaspirillum denitrificans TaxID=1968433 RepID=A0A254TJI0_9BURK|nr:RluA family pseudouridine synthase [Noviherbaspirillum denitrificans]OWW22810.1 RNA pseudouridine synthase [Noviherbaspirillum denitrificans]
MPETDIDDGDEYEGSAPETSPITLKLTSQFCGVRLDKALSLLLTDYSRSRIQQWIDAGHVTVDGQPARGKTTMLGDETIVVEPQEAEEEQAYKPEAMPLSIVHEDKAILVINKPAGLVVHPAAGNWSGTLLNGLLHHAPALATVPRAGIVHRLDKETSGLMVVAKTLQAQTDLVRQLQARTVKREYLALVWGQPQVSGRIEAAIGRHPRDRIRMAVSHHESAKAAVTHYNRLATGSLDGRQVSLIKCRLETGRTHQIRVHMQSIGFSLVGDPLYGKPHLASVFPRQALHAFRLGLGHPASGKELEWTADVPEDLSGLLERAGLGGIALE